MKALRKTINGRAAAARALEFTILTQPVRARLNAKWDEIDLAGKV